MVIAHHLIWTTYGAWPPNDLRGSTSKFVHHAPLFELANLHHGRKRIQPCNADLRAFLTEAAGKLKFPVFPLRSREFQELAAAIRETIAQNVYTCYACAFMPDHVHLLIRKHKHLAEEMIRNLQVSSRLRFRSAGLRTPDHPLWGGPGWKVFLDTPEEIRRTINYIEANPKKLHVPVQLWDFVKQYDGWPLHPGHNPNSPYARAIRPSAG